MSAKQELLDYLFNDPTRELIDFSFTPGPEADEESVCREMLESMKRADRGELIAYTPRCEKDPVEAEDFLKDL